MLLAAAFSATRASTSQERFTPSAVVGHRVFLESGFQDAAHMRSADVAYHADGLLSSLASPALFLVAVVAGNVRVIRRGPARRLRRCRPFRSSFAVKAVSMELGSSAGISIRS